MHLRALHPSFLWHFFFASFPKKVLPKAVPWTQWDSVKAIAFAALFLTIITYGGFFLSSYLWGFETAAIWFMENIHLVIVFSLVLQVGLQIFFLFWYSARKYHVKLVDLGFRDLPFSQFLAVTGLLLICGIFGQNIYFSIFGMPETSEFSSAAMVDMIIRDEIIPFPAFLIFGAIVVPILEELTFRGLLLSSLLKKHSVFWSIFLSSVIFGAVHMSFALMPVYMFMGALLALAYLRTGSLLPGIAYHMINNGLALILHFQM